MSLLVVISFHRTVGARWVANMIMLPVTHLHKLTEVFVLAQLIEVVDRLGVVETVVVVDFAVAC